MSSKKRRISENPSGLKVFSLAIASALVVAHLLFWWIEGGEVIWALLFTLLLWGLLWWSLTNLRGVEFDGESLFLSNGKERTEVPLDDVLDIAISHSRNRTVHVSYRDSRGIVRKVWFRPLVSADPGFTSPERPIPHPRIQELHDVWATRKLP